MKEPHIWVSIIEAFDELVFWEACPPCVLLGIKKLQTLLCCFGLGLLYPEAKSTIKRTQNLEDLS